MTYRPVSTDKEGWLIDDETGKHLWMPSPGDGKVQTWTGWLHLTNYEEPEDNSTPNFQWPTLRYAPYHFGSGTYADAHPERYDDVWREDVKVDAEYLVQNYDCWVNTYVDHPPGWGLDSVSLDIWGPAGRGDQVNGSGDAGFWDLFNNGKPPWIRWCIRDGWIWDDYFGWREYWDNDVWSDGGHWKHRHITFW